MVDIVGPHDLIEVAQGIYYSRAPFPVINCKTIDLLKKAALSTPQRRARFCAHPSPDARRHDMLIVAYHDTYIAPHRHLSKSETFAVLEGVVEIILFDPKGHPQTVFKMGSPTSGLPFFYRMPARQFHSLAIESELLVFMESTDGPFRKGDSENAPWAPQPDDAMNGRAFLTSVLAKCRNG